MRCSSPDVNGLSSVFTRPARITSAQHAMPVISSVAAASIGSRPTRSSDDEYGHTLCHTLSMAVSERVAVTLAAELVEEIDRLERNRSRFITDAVRHELSRRRRDALLQSVSNPHPETVELVDVGLADWTSDLPADEGLVDPAGGTAVRWVEGQGWIEEPV